MGANDQSGSRDAEEKIGIQVGHANRGAPAVITVGGLNLRPGLPNWEFARSLSRSDMQVIFVRDLAQAWYQFGIESSSTFNSAVADVKKAVESLDAPRVSVVGSSAAGILALMLSVELPAFRTLLFTPQTTIHPLDRALYRDFRWQARILRAYRARQKLLRVPTDVNVVQSQVRIIFGSENRLDRCHAARIRGADLHPLPGVSTHMVAKHLRDIGHLKDHLDWLIGKEHV